jgi:hypothetical protein
LEAGVAPKILQNFNASANTAVDQVISTLQPTVKGFSSQPPIEIEQPEEKASKSQRKSMPKDDQPQAKKSQTNNPKTNEESSPNMEGVVEDLPKFKKSCPHCNGIFASSGHANHVRNCAKAPGKAKVQKTSGQQPTLTSMLSPTG